MVHIILGVTISRDPNKNGSAIHLFIFSVIFCKQVAASFVL